MDKLSTVIIGMMFIDIAKDEQEIQKLRGRIDTRKEQINRFMQMRQSGNAFWQMPRVQPDSVGNQEIRPQGAKEQTEAAGKQ